MSRGVRSEGLAWSSSELLKLRDELEEQVPGDGAMCRVGITERPHKPERAVAGTAPLLKNIFIHPKKFKIFFAVVTIIFCVRNTGSQV
jgi:hypothetical protein